MEKIQTLEALSELRQKLKANSLIDLPTEPDDRAVLAVGMATCGIAAGGEAVFKVLQEEIAAQGIADKVTLVSTGCLGYCYMEPLVEVRLPGKTSILYGDVDEAKAREIVKEHLVNGRILEKAIIGRRVQKA